MNAYEKWLADQNRRQWIEKLMTSAWFGGVPFGIVIGMLIVGNISEITVLRWILLGSLSIAFILIVTLVQNWDSKLPRSRL